MKLFLLAVALALFCAVHGFFDDKKEGLFVATCSEDPHIQKHMHDMKVLKATFSKVEGDVVVKTRIPTPKGCKDIEMVFTKGADGKYYHKCGFGEKKVEVIETDGEAYAIVDVIVTRKDQTYRTSTLYVRDLESVPIGLVERFQRRCEEKGFTSDQIKIFPKEVACQD